MEEDEAERFGQNWKNVNNDMKFLENVNRNMNSLGYSNNAQNKQLQLGF